MKRAVIPAEQVAVTIGEALLRLARDHEASGAMEKLTEVLRVDEALAVAKLVLEERIVCARCSRPTKYDDANQTMCKGCFTAVKREQSAAAQ